MNHSGVIFDTNVYRTIAASNSPKIVFKDIKSSEEKNDILGFANPFVMMELSSHLADTSDPAFVHCYESIKILTQHCSETNNSIRIVMDSESFLCDFICGHKLKSAEDISQKLGKLCYQITNSNFDTLGVYKVLINEIAKEVNSIEKLFVNDVKRFVVNYFSNNSNDWEALKTDKPLQKKLLNFLNSDSAVELVGKGFVWKALILSKIEMPPDKIDEKTKELITVCKTPILFYIEMLKKIIISGCDFTKKNRENWIWDINIAFSFGSELRICDDRPIYLITNDKEVLKAGVNSGNDKYIISINDYFNFLGVKIS